MADTIDTLNDEVDTLETTSSSPSNSLKTTDIRGVRAVTLRPFYCNPGQPPIPPGTEVTVCPTSARIWLRSGIIRLSEGEKIPDTFFPQKEGQFPVFAKAAPPPPVSGG